MGYNQRLQREGDVTVSWKEKARSLYFHKGGGGECSVPMSGSSAG